MSENTKIELIGDGRDPDGHFRKGDAGVAKVGKINAGRLLDGREWNGVLT